MFGSQDWAYYLLSQIFVIISFYYVYKTSNEILKNTKLSIISVFLLEAIFFYNFTTPEFNVNICQLPFWSIVVYYSWRIIQNKEITFKDCLIIGLCSSIGFLSKYLFIYLLVSISSLFVYLIFYKKIIKFDFKYLIIFEVFIILLIPHLIWLNENDFITISYGLKRTGIESYNIIDHIKYPLIFIGKQFILLAPFFLLTFLLLKKVKVKFNLKDKKLIFLIFINFLPIFLILITSVITGSRIRTMWMTPFYLFIGLLFVYIFQLQINFKKINSFLFIFVFLFLLSPSLYLYISIK